MSFSEFSEILKIEVFKFQEKIEDDSSLNGFLLGTN